MFEYLWWPCMATVAAISLSAILFKEFLKKKKRARQIAVEGRADSDSAAENGTVERAARTSTSPRVSETASSSGHDYDVFLSFRGRDTRAGFTDFLYTSLVDAGIRAFKDDEELRVGEEFASELLQAIKQSKISIPIFSKGYASSVWCLKELVQMVECKKSGGHKIMPIFYDVAPSEVRHQTGDYGEAFRSHENKKRSDAKTISQWKAALEEVSSLNGWDLHSMPNREEGKFTKTVTELIFNELKKAYLVVPDNFVGSHNNRIDTIMEMIGAQTSETRIIGIYGMGGIGKTTIAKIIYNQLSNNFKDCCCCISNIREMSERKGIEYLQKQLISSILKTKGPDIKNIDEGIQFIKDRLSNKKVLLLLDDVEQKDQLDALVGKRDWFGKGSKVIITTRNKEGLEVDDCYEVNIMDCEHSLQLFSKHAFRRDDPLDEYIDESKKAIEIAGGLPLALEVIGSLLFDKNKDMWNATLEKLANVPPTNVQSKLKISYDALSDGEKCIFLDIACLFIGCDKDILVYFLNANKLFPMVAMEVLQNMCLIKITENNEVWMHDQLRDLGRQIVRQESNWKIKKQSRVWNTEEALDLLRRKEGKTKVEALRLMLYGEGEYHFTYEDFKRLSDLRFFEVGGFKTVDERLLWNEWASNGLPTNVLQENSNLLPQLRWLSLSNIPPTFNITNFSMKDVVILDLSDSEITDDWEGWSYTKVMRNLKVLDLANCEELQTLSDELGRDLASLELLFLQGCQSLERLPNSIGNLKSLIELNISGTNIKGLGKCISRNKSLRILRLSDAKIHALPTLPQSLIELHLSDLYMDTFPNLSNLTNLKKLDLKFGPPADSDEESDGPMEEHQIPWWIRSLTKLESLILSCHFVTTSPTDLSFPPRLKELELQCPNLRRLPTLPSSLSSLQLSDCESLCSMGDLSNLKNLSSLDILSSAIVEIQGLGCLENLRDLELERLEQVKTLPDLRNLSKLRSLQVSYCDNLVEIQGDLPQFLDEFQIISCRSLEKLPDLSSLMGKQDVQEVHISTCVSLVEIQREQLLQSSKKLYIESCESLKKFPDMSRLMGLREVHICKCGDLVEIQRGLPRFLEKLRIEYCGSLQNLPCLWSLMGLRDVFIYQCGDLVEIQGGLPRSLEKLWIENCESLQNLPCLSSSMRLRDVFISQCGDLVEIQGGLPRSLEKLRIENCESLQNLPRLSSSMGLRDVFIYQCGDLVEIQGGLPRSLEKLRIENCESLQNLPRLSSSMGLRDVVISQCGDLIEIQGKLPQSLERLTVSFCKSLQKLPDFSSSMGLRKVEIDSVNLVEIQGGLSRSLEKLWIENCESLQNLPRLSSSMGLRDVFISQCGDLVEIQGGLPRSLERLRIENCESLQNLPRLSSSMGLRDVVISQCGDLVEIQGKLPESLERLTISFCKSLQKLPDFSSSMGLRKVEINSVNLVEIQGGLPQSLEKLWIENCESLQNLPRLSSSMGLRDVFISQCGDLVKIQGGLPRSLEKLRIENCESLQNLPRLSSSMGLRDVFIYQCGDLVEIQGGLPRSLEKLRIENCESLQNLPRLSSSMGLRDVVISQCGDLVEIQGKLPESLERLTISFCKSLQKLPDFSSSMGLRKVEINSCRKLNEETISLLCSEKSVEFVGDDNESESEGEDAEYDEWDREEEESKSEGEDTESESEYDEWDREEEESKFEGEDAESESESEYD